jgi:hypothetical protein
MPLIFCPECGNQTSDQAPACNKCGYPIAKLNFNQASNTGANTSQASPASPASNNFSGLDYYYQQEFEEIQKSKEEYRGKFNWWAFFFSWIWCFTKGAWGWALVLILANLITSFYLPHIIRGEIGLLFSFLFGLGTAITFGHNATKIYYNVRVKNKQF